MGTKSVTSSWWMLRFLQCLLCNLMVFDGLEVVSECFRGFCEVSRQFVARFERCPLEVAPSADFFQDGVP